ncbi:hypothetical protein HIM_11464 [Hirsutella minnesotensis 3608]|uniref:DNA helicase Pif1-like 2B domain-containing protein n=1 Tax=Hirsutella minnesotensis 3608 TaxID=1043627 RepID=A0A0F7ZFH4_9HYPO|nr:hypothetical protein HIM_11464 [Hirsutella minnesotensis 3608]
MYRRSWTIRRFPGRPVIQVMAKKVGPGAAAAPDDKAGNPAKQIPVCIGARLMLTSNLWQPVGLCNGARLQMPGQFLLLNGA